MENMNPFTRTVMNAVTGVPVFGVTLWTVHVVCIVILRVFFGVKENSSLIADVMIFGMILGSWLAFAGSLGYLISSVVFSVLRSRQPSLRHRVCRAIASALVVYLLIWSRLLSGILEFLRQKDIFDGDFMMVLAPWTMGAVLSTLLVCVVADAIERP
jgi:hypothetical protein